MVVLWIVGQFNLIGLGGPQEFLLGKEIGGEKECPKSPGSDVVHLVDGVR